MQTIAGSAFKVSHQSQRAERPIEKAGIRNRVSDPQVNKGSELPQRTTDKVVPINGHPSGAETALSVSCRGRGCERRHIVPFLEPRCNSEIHKGVAEPA